MNNVTERAVVRAKLIGHLVRFLETGFDGLDDEQVEAIQHSLDNPPAHIPPEELAKYVFVEVAELISHATEMDWALARVLAGERERNPARAIRRHWDEDDERDWDEDDDGGEDAA